MNSTILLILWGWDSGTGRRWDQSASTWVTRSTGRSLSRRSVRAAKPQPTVTWASSDSRQLGCQAFKFSLIWDQRFDASPPEFRAGRSATGAGGDVRAKLGSARSDCGSSGKRHHSIEPSAYVKQISNASGWEIGERRSDSGPADRPVDREERSGYGAFSASRRRGDRAWSGTFASVVRIAGIISGAEKTIRVER